MGASSATDSAVARAADARYVFEFAEGGRGDVALLGGKGAGLAHLMRLGLPVPPGFTVTTRAGRDYLAAGRIPDAALVEIRDHLTRLEARTGRRLDDAKTPLFVSVRSGAPVSMPGMMDTVLNVGMNARTVEALAAETGDPHFAWDCYARFVEAYVRIVRSIDAAQIEDCLMELDGKPPRVVVAALLALVAEIDGRPMPEEPLAQILEAIGAVFGSWDSARAKAYRRFRGIPHTIATAATVQAMVFGNRGARSGSGVAFTRDPSTGEPGAFGDVLFNAQGEEVVAGERDTAPLASMAERVPEVHAAIGRALATIEADAGDLCEVEFTIEDGRLYILQTRVGLRSGRAALRVAVSLADSGRIAIETAIDRITPAQLEAAGAPGFASAFPGAAVIAAGLAASPGAAAGHAVFDPGRAMELAAAGQAVILFRPTTSPGDVAGFIAARAVVTGRGGRTSHAAVVARGMHRPAVCGIGDLKISTDRKGAALGGTTIREGELVSVDGDRGLVARGEFPLGIALADPAVQRFGRWCEERRRVPLLTRAEIDALPVVNTLADLASRTECVVLVLEDPARIPAVELAKALEQRHAAPPVLLLGEAWLRAADVRLRGRVTGLVVPDGLLSARLLQATLDPADAT